MIGIKVNLDPLERAFNKARRGSLLRIAVVPHLHVFGRRAEARMKKQVSAQETTETRLATRSGRLRNSIAFEVSMERGSSGNRNVAHLELGAMRFGTRAAETVKYIRVHELGDGRGNPLTIKPKAPNKFLWIPVRDGMFDGLPGALTPAGVARFTPREMIGSPELIQGMGGKISGSFVRTAGGKGTAFVIRAPRGKTARSKQTVIPVFFLRKSVTITPRPFIKPAFDEAAEGVRRRLGDIIAAEINKDLKGE